MDKLVDLTIDEENGDVDLHRLAHRPLGRVGPGIVDDDRRRALRDRGVDELGLLIDVVVMGEGARLVAEGLGGADSGLRLRLEERIVMGRGDDRDVVGGGRVRGAGGRHQGQGQTREGARAHDGAA